MTFTVKDKKYMSMALELAIKGIHGVKENPLVGCVIVLKDKVIASGYHQHFGKEHAEVNALKAINYVAKNATMYVSLSPCNHYGKTPPCVDLIIKSGIKKIIIAAMDENKPVIREQGLDKLRQSGIEVLSGLLEDEANEINRGFIKKVKTGLPFITSKIAMTIDGKTSMPNGESKWITSDSSRLDVQKLRSNNQAILTGSSTVLQDNPKMTVRLDNSKNTPIRIVIDSKNRITDKNLNIFSSEAKTIILNNKNCKTIAKGKIDLQDALMNIAKLGINTVLLEAGPKLNAAMLEAGLIDEIVIYIAPTIFGSEANSMMDLRIKDIKDKVNLQIKDLRHIENDIKITATIA